MKKASDNPCFWYAELKHLQPRMKHAGVQKKTDAEVVTFIMSQIPDKYEVVMSALRLKPRKELWNWWSPSTWIIVAQNSRMWNNPRRMEMSHFLLTATRRAMVRSKIGRNSRATVLWNPEEQAGWLQQAQASRKEWSRRCKSGRKAE